ncbi:unnamed protein product [Rotaria magnacalcarata]
MVKLQPIISSSFLLKRYFIKLNQAVACTHLKSRRHRSSDTHIYIYSFIERHMEQPESNPTFCTNNCGFYGSSQFEGMCSKCYREHVSRSLTTGRTNSCNSFYTSNPSVSSSQTLLPNTSTDDEKSMRDDQDEVVGHMDEDNDLPNNIIDQTVNKMDDDNSESASAAEEQSETTKETTDQSIHESSASLLTRVVSTPTMPMNISRSIDIPGKKDSNISLSVMETGSLGAESMSPLTASSVDKKKRSRCTWPSCNKKLGLADKSKRRISIRVFLNNVVGMLT